MHSYTGFPIAPGGHKSQSQMINAGGSYPQDYRQSTSSETSRNAPRILPLPQQECLSPITDVRRD